MACKLALQSAFHFAGALFPSLFFVHSLAATVLNNDPALGVVHQNRSLYAPRFSSRTVALALATLDIRRWRKLPRGMAERDARRSWCYARRAWGRTRVRQMVGRQALCTVLSQGY